MATRGKGGRGHERGLTVGAVCGAHLAYFRRQGELSRFLLSCAFNAELLHKANLLDSAPFLIFSRSNGALEKFLFFQTSDLRGVTCYPQKFSSFKAQWKVGGLFWQVRGAQGAIRQDWAFSDP